MSAISSFGNHSAMLQQMQRMQQMQGRTPAAGGGQKLAEALFSKIDVSGQGAIDQGEMSSAVNKALSSSPFAAGNVIDANAAAEQLFAQMDGDADGKVTRQEFKSTLAMLSGRFEHHGAAGQGDAAGMDPMQGMGAMPGMGAMQGMPPAPPPGGEFMFDSRDDDDDARNNANSDTRIAGYARGNAKGNGNGASSDDIQQQILSQVMKMLHAYESNATAGSASNASNTSAARPGGQISLMA